MFNHRARRADAWAYWSDLRNHVRFEPGVERIELDVRSPGARRAGYKEGHCYRPAAGHAYVPSASKAEPVSVRVERL
jgi:hypothetical protein